MTNYTKFLLFLTFIGIWISHLLSENSLILLGYALILTFGILHGSNDLVLIAKENNNRKKKHVFLIKYLLTISFFSGIFFYFRGLGFIVFFTLSAYHFGEQHINVINSKKSILLITAARFTYGLLILSLVLFFHQKEVIGIITTMSNYEVPQQFFGFLLISTILIFSALIYVTQKNATLPFSVLFEVFLLLVFGLLFKLTPLIWGFALYFIIWHSLPSIKSQCEFLYEEFSFNTVLKYVKSALLIWLLSVASLGVFFYLFQNNKNTEALLFSFIAAITFPHVFTIFSLFNKKTE